LILNDAVRALLDLPGTFARLSTILPDGAPQSTVIWFRRDGDTLRLACGAGAMKARNIRRDGRVSVVVEKPADPYNFVEIRGIGEVVEDDALAREEFVHLAHRYVGQERGDAWVKTLGPSPVVVLVIRPTKVSLFTDQEP